MEWVKMSTSSAMGWVGLNTNTAMKWVSLNTVLWNVKLTQCDGIVKGEHKQCYRMDKLEHSATE